MRGIIYLIFFKKRKDEKLKKKITLNILNKAAERT